MAGDPIKVLVTGAAGQIAYSLISSVAKGEVFGLDQPVCLHLLDIAPMVEVLKGVVMEVNDCAFPLLTDIVATVNEKEAFTGIDAAFLVGSMPRREGMERKDLLAANVKIFKSQGKALDQYAKKDVKVLVVGNPANTNALICSKYAPSIPKANFTAMTRLDQNRATSQIAERLKKNVGDVSSVIIWGNHSSTQYPDVLNATVKMGEGVVKSVYEAINNDEYLQGEFITNVQKRGAAVIAARKLSSAMSAAKAACDHMRDWFKGTDGRIVSMGVYSDGSYGAAKDVIFSFPVTIKDGQWAIVQDLTVSEFSNEKLAATGKELLEEKEEALSVCQD